MRKYLEGRLASNGVFVSFGRDYVKMKPLVQADRFGNYAFGKVERLTCKMTLLVQH